MTALRSRFEPDGRLTTRMLVTMVPLGPLYVAFTATLIVLLRRPCAAVTVSDGISFPTAAHLAPYAGLAPTSEFLGNRDPRRTRTTRRKPAAQTHHVPVRVRTPARPRPLTYYDSCRAPGKTASHHHVQQEGPGH